MNKDRKQEAPVLSTKEAKMLLPIVNEAILFHQAYHQGQVDAIVWNNLRPTKEGGRATLELMLKNTRSLERKEQLRKDLEYWELHYEDIKRDVYDHHLNLSNAQK